MTPTDALDQQVLEALARCDRLDGAALIRAVDLPPSEVIAAAIRLVSRGRLRIVDRLFTLGSTR